MRRGKESLIIISSLYIFVSCSCSGSNKISCPEVNGIVTVEPTFVYAPQSVTLTVTFTSPETPVENASLTFEKDIGAPADYLENVTIANGLSYSSQLSYTVVNDYRPRVVITWKECEYKLIGDLVSVRTRVVPKCRSTYGPTFLYLNSGGQYSVDVNTFGAVITAYAWRVDLGNDGTVDNVYVTDSYTFNAYAATHFNRLGLNALEPVVYTADGESVACPKRGVTVAIPGEYVLATKQSTGSGIAVPFKISTYLNTGDILSLTSPAPATFMAFASQNGLSVIDLSQPASPAVKGMIFESYCTVDPLTNETTCELSDNIVKVYFDPATYSCIYAGVLNSSGTAMSPVRVYRFSPGSGVSRAANLLLNQNITDYGVYYDASVTATILVACDSSLNFMWGKILCTANGVTIKTFPEASVSDMCRFVAPSRGNSYRYIYTLYQVDSSYTYNLRRCKFEYPNAPNCDTGWVTSPTINGKVVKLEAVYTNGITFMAVLMADHTASVYEDEGTRPVLRGTVDFSTVCGSNDSNPPADVRIKDGYMFISAAKRGFHVYSLPISGAPQRLTSVCRDPTSSELYYFGAGITDGAYLYLAHRNVLRTYLFQDFLNLGEAASVVSVQGLSGTNGTFVYSGNSMFMAGGAIGLLEFDMSSIINGGNVIYLRSILDPREDFTSVVNYTEVSTGPDNTLLVAASDGLYRVYPDSSTSEKLIGGYSFNHVTWDGVYIYTSDTDGNVYVWEPGKYFFPVYTDGPFYYIYALAATAGVGYAAGGSSGLVVVKAATGETLRITYPGTVRGVDIGGSLLFLNTIDSDVLYVYDITDPQNPVYVSKGVYPLADGTNSYTARGVSSSDGKVVVIGIGEDSTLGISAGFSLFRTITPTLPEYGGTGSEVGSGGSRFVNIWKISNEGYNYLVTIVNNWVYFFRLGKVD